MMRRFTEPHTIWWPNEVLAADPNWTSSVHIGDCSDGLMCEDCMEILIYLYYYPEKSIIRH
jgi:hypothetical protein